MGILEFMSDSPYLSFFCLWLILAFLETAIKVPCRAANIRKHGWPPEHCDADGDIKKKENADD